MIWITTNDGERLIAHASTSGVRFVPLNWPGRAAPSDVLNAERRGRLKHWRLDFSDTSKKLRLAGFGNSVLMGAGMEECAWTEYCITRITYRISLLMDVGHRRANICTIKLKRGASGRAALITIISHYSTQRNTFTQMGRVQRLSMPLRLTVSMGIRFLETIYARSRREEVAGFALGPIGSSVVK